MNRLESLLRGTFPVLLLLIAFLPRAVQPVSRPLVWYLRSAHFIDAVLAGDWSNTVYSEHPGVTLMWPVGASLKLYWTITDINPAAYTVPPDFEPIHFFGPVSAAEIAAALFPLALLIALGIVGAYFMLHRLFDEVTAAVGGLLLSLSPYYLAQSKVLHLDALMATLMLLSALAVLLYRRERRARWLFVSGTLGGLALLTKPPAIFLVPFCGLVLLVDVIRSTQRVHALPGRLLLPLLTWLLLAALVYVALWPVMWIAPGKGLAAVKWGLTKHATIAHDTPSLFLGRILRRDPGPLFYVISLLFRTGEVELTFLAVAAVFGATHLIHRRRLSQIGVDYVLLLAYALFFLAQMCLGAKKMPRYVIPSILALDVLAAAGIVAWARGLAGEKHRPTLVLIALPVLVQSVLVLPRHPYYGTALNWLGGGPPAAARSILIGEEGEGLAELSAYLNARPDAEQLTVAAQLKHVFNQTFHGTTVEIDERPADYLAFHRNYTARDYKIQHWGDLWERYGARTPEREIGFDGVAYAWLYPVLPSGTHPEHARPIHVGEHFRFLGYDLRSTRVSPGDRVPVVLYWQATQSVTDDLSVFLHLLGPNRELVWQEDGAATHGDRPTWSWEAGETIVDPHAVELPVGLPEGEYLLTAGLYDWRTGERLPVVNAQGQSMDRDQIPVATLTVCSPGTHPAAWLARGLASLVLLSTLGAVLRLRSVVVKAARRCYNKRRN